MALKEVIRTFRTPINVGGITNTTKHFYEGDLAGAPLELSVLPGLHRETFKQAEAQLESILQSHSLETEALYPSVRFALEAWQFKKSKQDQTAPWNHPVTLNALLLSPSLTALESARAKGFKSFKIKIGRQESANDLLAILKILNNDESLRLDGNRLLSPQALVSLVTPLKDYWSFIEYIEEPFSKLDEYQSWDHPLKLALDESLPAFINKTLPNNVCAVVLKPSLYGFNRSVALIKNFNQAGVPVTLSSSFEGPIGLEAITTLSSLQNSFRPNPAGLDTLSYFI